MAPRPSLTSIIVICPESQQISLVHQKQHRSMRLKVSQRVTSLPVSGREPGATIYRYTDTFRSADSINIMSRQSVFWGESVSGIESDRG